MYDLIVIGGGPAGLTSALYGRRAGKTVLVLEKNIFGGQITWSPKVENFPTISSISGLDFADRLTAQVMESGADLELDEVISIEKEESVFLVKTEFGGAYHGKALIIATGAQPRQLGLSNEQNLIGSGISFCAVCDGEFFKDRVVAVNGGGNTALQEALYLSSLCKTVYLIHRREEFRADQALVDAVLARPNIICVLNSVISEIIGENKLEQLIVLTKDGDKTNYVVDGLFIAVGHLPETNLVRNMIALDSTGYVTADESCITNHAGVFVAGDCRAKNVRQLTTAMGDGAVAALAACQYLDQNKI